MLLGDKDEIMSFPLRRLIRTRIANPTLASQAPKARINIGIVINMVDVEDRVNDNISVNDKIEASKESRHISNLFRMIIIDEIVIIEINKVNSCG